MARIPFDELPNYARLWIFPASRALTETLAGALFEVPVCLRSHERM